MNLRFAICAAFAACATNSNAETKITSTYTKIDNCEVSEKSDEFGALARKCKGPGGYNIYVLYDDDRVSIDVTSPNKHRHELKYWDKIQSFSRSHNTIEWRIESSNGKIQPIAIISKIYSTQHQDIDKPRKVVFFVISKIDTDSICITDIVQSKANHNLNEIRLLADKSKNKPCI